MRWHTKNFSSFRQSHHNSNSRDVHSTVITKIFQKKTFNHVNQIFQSFDFKKGTDVNPILLIGLGTTYSMQCLYIVFYEFVYPGPSFGSQGFISNLVLAMQRTSFSIPVNIKPSSPSPSPLVQVRHWSPHSCRKLEDTVAVSFFDINSEQKAS